MKEGGRFSLSDAPFGLEMAVQAFLTSSIDMRESRVLHGMFVDWLKSETNSATFEDI